MQYQKFASYARIGQSLEAVNGRLWRISLHPESGHPAGYSDTRLLRCFFACAFAS